MSEKERKRYFERPTDIASADAQIREVSTAFFVLAAIQGTIGLLLGPWMLFDAAIYAGGGLWLRRSKRVAAALVLLIMALLGAVSTVLNRIGVQSEGGNNVFLMIFMLAAAGKALQATMAHREFARREPDYRKPAAWPSVVGVGLVGLLALAVSLSFFMASGILPPDAVVAGEELNPSAVDFLMSERIVEPDERIVLYYSASMTSYEAEGTVLTDRRVLAYEKVADGVWVDGYAFDDIDDVIIENPGGPVEFAVIRVEGTDGGSFQAYLTDVDDGVHVFVDALRSRMAGG